MGKPVSEDKLRSRQRKSGAKSLLRKEDSLFVDFDSMYTPIDIDPPYQKTEEPTIFQGDLVEWFFFSEFDLVYCNDEGKQRGIVLESRWIRTEISSRFSKKKNDWVSKFACIPQSIVMWNDGSITSVPMKMLSKINGT